MKLCFPVQQDEGFDSEVFNHFGSAPIFVVIDTEANDVASIINRDANHIHGACNPAQALNHEKVDAVIVGGIGAGALGKLNQMGIAVHRSLAPTIRENVTMFAAGSLPVLNALDCCSGHGKDGACAH